MIEDVIKYINCFINGAKIKYPIHDETKLASALMYQYYFSKHYSKYIPIENILKWNDNVSLRCPRSCLLCHESDVYELTHDNMFDII